MIFGTRWFGLAFLTSVVTVVLVACPSQQPTPPSPPPPPPPAAATFDKSTFDGTARFGQ